MTRITIIATLAPSHYPPNRRAEQLSQEALDLMAWAFRNVTLDPVGLPLCAVEVRLDDPLNHLLHGGEGLSLHGGDDAPRYFRDADDPGWALVFAHDCTGDPERGAEILRRHDP